MINFIISENFYSLFAGIGLMAAFLMTCVCITKFNYLLPKDAGRDFAHDGKLSAGKPNKQISSGQGAIPYRRYSPRADAFPAEA